MRSPESGWPGNPPVPYLNTLAAQGASFDKFFAITRPSEPNCPALFSGSTQGVTDDSCPHTFFGASLGQEPTAPGDTFASYSESMPSDGYSGCTSGDARKDGPRINFSNVSASSNLTYGGFPSDYTTLPTVSFVAVTWDEDDDSTDNQIPTIFVRPAIAPGAYFETISHYSVLGALEDLYALPHAGAGGTATPNTDIGSSASLNRLGRPGNC